MLNRRKAERWDGVMRVSHKRVRSELGRQRRDEPEDVLLSPAVMISCGLASVGYEDNEDDNNMLPRMATAIQLYIRLIHSFTFLQRYNVT